MDWDVELEVAQWLAAASAVLSDRFDTFGSPAQLP